MGAPQTPGNKTENVFPFMVHETGNVGMLLSGALYPGWSELAESDKLWEPGSTRHSVGVGVIATGCSGSSVMASRSLGLVNRFGCELMSSSSIVVLGK